VQGHKRQKREIFALRKVVERGGMVATVASMKAATGVWRWRGGQGIAGVSEIEETPRMTPVFGV
jgi:hypothetical protein